MTRSSADVVICGAGIAGISAAYHLAVKHGIGNVVLLDELTSLSLTSDKYTECYRNWWPGPGDAMVSLMNRSIDILEDLANESDNVFNVNRRVTFSLLLTQRVSRTSNGRRKKRPSWVQAPFGAIGPTPRPSLCSSFGRGLRESAHRFRCHS